MKQLLYILSNQTSDKKKINKILKIIAEILLIVSSKYTLVSSYKIIIPAKTNIKEETLNGRVQKGYLTIDNIFNLHLIASLALVKKTQKVYIFSRFFIRVKHLTKSISSNLIDSRINSE